MENAEAVLGPYSSSHFKRDGMYILDQWREDGSFLPHDIAGHFTEGDFRAAKAASWLMSMNNIGVTTKYSKSYYDDRGRPESSITAFRTFIQRFRGGPCHDYYNPLSATTFIPFPRLSVELRLKIWTFALPNYPRFVEIQTTGAKIAVDDNEEDEDDEKYIGTKTWRPICKARPPELLFVCQESRIVAKESYLPVKGNEPGSPTVYCNFAKDIFCFSCTGFHSRVGQFLRRIFKETGQKIGYLALEYSAFCDSWPTKNEDLLNCLDLRDLMIADDMTDDREPSAGRIIGFDRNDELEDPDAWSMRVLPSLREQVRGIKKQNANWTAPQVMIGEFVLN